MNLKLHAAILALLALGCATESPEASDPEPDPEPAPPEPEAPAPPVESATAPAPPKEKVLAHFLTWFKAGKGMDGRVTNITRVAEKFSDLVVQPGEEVSFNKLVGPRTEENGFKNAPTYFMGEILEGIGGGTCQVSSTLYAGLLHAGVQITDRRPHSRPSSYVEPGLDATVNYPAECQTDKPDPRVCYDFKFKNAYDFPLRIQMIPGPEPTEEVDGIYKRRLDITVLGTGDVPKITTEWKAWESSPFVKRIRRNPYWKNDRTRVKQPGQNGLTGARVITSTYPDGRVETTKIRSVYQPVPEVWEVGLEWKDPEAKEATE